MKNGQNLSVTLALAAIALLASSCEISSADVFPFGRKSSQSIKVNVSSPSNYSETKSDSDFVLMHTFGDDDFSISEYVSDISNIMDLQETKGSIITTTGINSNGQSFTVDGWGMISPGKGKPQELTNHLVKLTASYTASGTDHWPWADGANPKWVNEANLHIWSYYPVGKINPTITIDDTTPANNTAKFSYTTDNTDLLIAYNNEYREFETDAAGNHTYDDDGVITNPMVTGQSESFNVHFYHALAAIKFELSDQMKTDKVDVKKITITTSDGGFYTTGNCTVTGPSLAAPTTDGTRGVVWSTTGNKSPIVCEFTPIYPYPNSSTPTTVATGLASTGSGVLFMIPQTATSSATITVEFCRYGGGSVIRTQTIPANKLKWEAGKYYKYVFDGEIHVPGEMVFGPAKLEVPNLSGGNAQLFANNIKIKGVTKIGMIIDGYNLKNNNDNAGTVYITGSGSNFGSGTTPANTATTITGVNFTTTNIPKGTVSGNSYSNSYTIQDKIFVFGQDASDTEIYYSYYNWTMPKTGGSGATYDLTSNPLYYVFDISANNDSDPDNNIDEFNVWLKTSSASSNGYLYMFVRGVMVLEVKNN